MAKRRPSKRGTVIEQSMTTAQEALYDPRCGELAEVFLEEFRREHPAMTDVDHKKYTHFIARDIQQAIEGALDDLAAYEDERR